MRLSLIRDRHTGRSSLSSEALFKFALAAREVQLLKQWLRRPDITLNDEPLLQVVQRYADSYNLASGVDEFVSDLVKVKPPDKASGVQLQTHVCMRVCRVV